MSNKRQATTDLNHENWDREDPAEHEDMGSFKTAAKDVLEKRVIRTAKRRSQNQASGDEPKKSVFSGFGGFNKAPPSSFDFLANLTNGNKTTNGSAADKNDTSVTSSLFGSKVASSGAMFNMPVSSSSTTKSTFGSLSQTSSLFGGSTTTTGQSPFTAPKADSTVADSPFKIQATSSSKDTKDSKSKTTSQVSSTMFGVPSNNTNKSLFSATTSKSPFKIPPVTSNSTVQPNSGNTTKSVPNEQSSDSDTDDESDESKMLFHSKLIALNKSVLDWIKKHVGETPLCILSPIFKDYETYLNEIQKEYYGNKDETTSESNETTSDNTVIETKPIQTKPIQTSTPNTVPGFVSANSGVSLFPNESKTTSKSPAATPTATGFSFGIKPSTTNSLNTSNTSSSSQGFSFGIKTSPPEKAATISFGIKTSPPEKAATTSSPFSLATNTTTNTNGTAPFSFGIGKPFSFSANVEKPVEQTNETNEDVDEPPKVEFTPVVEENSVFDKRCKIFVKKDGSFADKGVGTLYIKKVQESGKHQLLVRANTNLGNVLVNLILTSSIPTQRLGKNNVMLVCIPTPDAKPPPTPVLIRVKTSEEADDLLEILNKFKV